MSKTKVRIALAVDSTGDWNATGWRGSDGSPAETEAMEIVADNLNPGERRYWVDVEVEVPSVETVRGTVSDA